MGNGKLVTVSTEAYTRKHQGKVQRAEEIAYCYEMSLRGYTYRQIDEASQLPREEGGIGKRLSAQIVMKRIDEGIKQRIEPARETYIAQEVDRLTRLYAKLDAAINEGDIQAIGTQVRVSERLCKLLGLDSAVRVTGTLAVDYSINGVDVDALR